MGLGFGITLLWGFQLQSSSANRRVLKQKENKQLRFVRWCDIIAFNVWMYIFGKFLDFVNNTIKAFQM